MDERERIPMLKVLASRKTVQEIESVFNEVCARHHFGVLGTINLRQKLNDKGVPFERECLDIRSLQSPPGQKGAGSQYRHLRGPALPDCRLPGRWRKDQKPLKLLHHPATLRFWVCFPIRN